MSAVADALKAFQDAQHNALNFANPDQAQSDAMSAWMQAVTDSISTGLGAVQTSVSESGDVSVKAVDIAAMVQTAVEAQLPAIEQQIAAAFGKLLTAQTTAPTPAVVLSTQEAPPSTEPPTITPQNPA